MAIQDKSFPLGVITVTVHTTDGQYDIQDWAPDDAADAKEYASETAHCGDVKAVDFANHATGEAQTFTNPALASVA